MKKILLIAGLLLGAVPSADAAFLVLQVSEDNVPLFSFGPVSGGMINITGGSGSFFTNISVTVEGVPTLDFPGFSVDVSASTIPSFPGTNNLTVTATEFNLMPTTAPTTFTNNYSVTISGSANVAISNLVSPSNQAFGVPLGSAQFSSTGHLSGQPGSSIIDNLATFAETIVLSMDAGAGTTINGTAIVAGVPEPGTWILMLLGLIGLAWGFPRFVEGRGGRKGSVVDRGAHVAQQSR